MVEAEGDALESLLNNLGLAVPVYVNLAISNAERITRELRLAMRRNRESRMIAIRAAESQLRSEIRDAVTGILLSTELAMRSPELPQRGHREAVLGMPACQRHPFAAGECELTTRPEAPPRYLRGVSLAFAAVRLGKRSPVLGVHSSSKANFFLPSQLHVLRLLLSLAEGEPWGESGMLWTIFAILIVLWLLGWGFHVAGSLIHLLLVVALAIAVVNLLTGRRAV